MRLEHVHLVVASIEASLKFYSAAFPTWSVIRTGVGKRRGKKCNWVHFGDDFIYIALTQYENAARREYVTFLGFSHVGFEVKRLEQIVARLSKIGARIIDNGEEHPFRKNIYFQDPDGNEIEFVEYTSEYAFERNSDNQLRA